MGIVTPITLESLSFFKDQALLFAYYPTADTSATVISDIIVADRAAGRSNRGLYTAFASEDRKVNFAGDSTIHRRMSERVDTARPLNLTYAGKDGAIATEGILASSRIPSQDGRRIRAILNADIEYFDRKRTGGGVA